MAAPTGKRVPDRRAGVGASEVGAVMGVSPYASARDIFVRKALNGADTKPTLRMEAGHALEPLIVAEASRALGMAFRRQRTPKPHATAPLYATVDAFCAKERTGLEVKTGYGRWEALPAFVRAQALAQLACWPTLDRIIVARFDGTSVEYLPVERDDDAIAEIVTAVSAFWGDHVLTGIPPQQRDVTLVVGGLPINATQEDERIWDEYQLTLAMKRNAEIEAARLRERLAAQGRDIIGAGWRGKWSERRTTAWAKVAEAVGADEAIVDAFTTTTPVFDLRETGR